MRVSRSAAAHQFGQRRVLGDLEPLAVVLVGHEEVPQSLSLGLLANLLEDFGLDVLLAVDVHFVLDALLDRVDVRIHEIGDALL